MSDPPITIWIFNHYAIPSSEAGGSRHYALAKKLIARGNRVVVIASCRNYQTPGISRLAAGETCRFEEIDGVPFLWLKTSGYRANGAGRLLNMLSYATRVLTREGLGTLPAPDIIIGSSPHPFAALAAHRVAVRRNLPFLLEVRDLWPQSLVDVGGVSKWHPFVMLLGAIERILYRRSIAVISLLPGAADHIRKVAGRNVNVIWVPNGVDVGLVERPKPAPEPPPFTLIYAGAHGEANGLDVVLSAAANLEQRGQANDLTIRLIGDGPEKQRLQARTTELGLRSVHFEDPVPKVAIYGRLAQAHGFLMLLKDSPVFRWGVSPNKLFDYMAVGRPVIFAVSTPYNPVALSAAGWTIAPGNSDALADAIVALRQSTQDERDAMGARGRAYVLENHGFEKLAARIERVCRDAIHQNARRSDKRTPVPGGDLVKRGFDVVMGAMAALLLSPLMLAVALIIRLTMGSPILFRQQRAGLGGRPFAIIKFRTMRSSHAPSWDPATDGERITRFGGFLRRWSLDELPQIFNVLSGEMSLVGPRPLPVDYNQRYTADQARRLDARPGITGWAQVNGRNDVDWEKRFLLDTWYLDHRSIRLDLKILLRTVSHVLGRRGISAQGSATMREFLGRNENEPAERPESHDVVV